MNEQNSKPQWDTAINRMIVGFILCVITLHLWHLHKILPILGLFLIFMGACSLHKVNVWFQWEMILCIIRIVCVGVEICVNATIWSQSRNFGVLIDSIDSFILVIICLQYICLWAGIQSVRGDAGLPVRFGSLAALLVWFTLIVICALKSYSGLIVISLPIIYLFILERINRMAKELTRNNYVVAVDGLSVRCVLIGILLIVLLATGLCAGYIIGGDYPMLWEACEKEQDTEISAISEQLIKAGMPRQVAEDLTDEELLELSNVKEVYVDEEDYNMEDGQKLHMTGVAVRLSDSSFNSKIIHYFSWNTTPTFYGTEAIVIWPSYSKYLVDWVNHGNLRGRLLYEKKSQIFEASYYRLEEANVTESSVLGESVSNDILAKFSFPSGGQNYRGYISYDAEAKESVSYVNSCINYVHQTTWMQYPAESAMEHYLSDGFCGSETAFALVQDALQFEIKEKD